MLSDRALVDQSIPTYFEHGRIDIGEDDFAVGAYQPSKSGPPDRLFRRRYPEWSGPLLPRSVR